MLLCVINKHSKLEQRGELFYSFHVEFINNDKRDCFKVGEVNEKFNADYLGSTPKVCF